MTDNFPEVVASGATPVEEVARWVRRRGEATGVDRAELLSYCLSKPGAWPDEPWEGDVVVKVGTKIFAFLGSESEDSSAAGVGLKCGPTREVADEWLARYPDDASVMAYIGRSGWNSLRSGGQIPDDELRGGDRRLVRGRRGQAAEEGPPDVASGHGRPGVA